MWLRRKSQNARQNCIKPSKFFALISQQLHKDGKGVRYKEKAAETSESIRLTQKR